jgi:hypothetical protein
MGVLAMLEIDGDTQQISAAVVKLERLMPEPAGVLARIVAPTDDGMVLFQLWESAEARQAHADNPAHADALRESGMLAAMTASRSRVFEDAQLSLPHPKSES